MLYHDGSLEVERSGVVRANFLAHHTNIASVADFKATLRAGQYAWPGGYQLFLLTGDGETLSFEAARSEYRQIVYSIQRKLNDGWRVVACDVNYEDAEMICAHTGKPIPASCVA